MPLHREVLERQLSQAKEVLSTHVQSMKANGAVAGDFRKCPVWRSLNANCNQIQRRLKAVAATAAINEDVARRKAEREGAGASA